MGVPQGSKLGPHLCSIYMGDIKHTEEENSGAVHYADDELSWTKTGKQEEMIRKTTNEMKRVSKQMQEWGMSINPKKSNS